MPSKFWRENLAAGHDVTGTLFKLCFCQDVCLLRWDTVWFGHIPKESELHIHRRENLKILVHVIVPIFEHARFAPTALCIV
jgi:hypothetical protein